MRTVEEQVKEFYDSDGWQGGEDALFRQFGPAYKAYHEKVNARTLNRFRGLTGTLLIAGGMRPYWHCHHFQTSRASTSRRQLLISLRQNCRKPKNSSARTVRYPKRKANSSMPRSLRMLSITPIQMSRKRLFEN
jgi:hypothetical protein